MAYTNYPLGSGRSQRGSRGITDIKLTLRRSSHPPSDAPVFPGDVLEMMQVTWQELIETFNVDGEFPDLQTLLRGADMAEPLYAAETVFVNMLSEIIDSVQRFSPWFNQPAKAFGLVLNRRRSAGSPKWVLTREAVRHWAAHLRGLSAAIEKNAGLILAVNLLGEMPKTDEAVDPRIMASCACDPPHIIMAHQSLLAGEKIACEVCRHPFRSFNASADDAMNGH